MNREQTIVQAVNDIVKENKGIENDTVALINKAWHRKAEYETQMFPEYCIEAYKANFLAKKALEQIGNKGRFTDTYGWSKDRNFLAKWVVPKELKLYMKNMVYFDFWDDSNAKVRDSFMKAICRGGTKQYYKDLLSKVVLYYGANSGKLIHEGTAIKNDI